MNKVGLKKTIRNTLGASAIVGGMLLGGYHFSEKIGHIEHKVQKELSDTLGKKEVLVDTETNEILKLMSGTISQEEFETLLKRHGQKGDTIQVAERMQPDSALYETLLEMQTKYGNPKITFSGIYRDWESFENQPERAYFRPITNTIHIHQLDSIMLKFKPLTTQRDTSFYTSYLQGVGSLQKNDRQQYLLNNRIAELAHAKQMKDRGVVKMTIDGAIDYASSGFDYDKTYVMPGTLEYEAHSLYEGSLAKEFVEIYRKYTDVTSEQNLWMLARLYTGFFDTYSNNEEGLSCLKELSQSGSAKADLLLGRYYIEKYYMLFYDPCIEVDDSIMKNINGVSYSAKSLFELVLTYYQKSYYGGNIVAGQEMIEVGYTMGYKYKDFAPLLLSVGHDLLENHIQELPPLILGNVYNKMGSLYYSLGDSIKGQQYLKLSEKYGGGFEYI